MSEFQLFPVQTGNQAPSSSAPPSKVAQASYSSFAASKTYSFTLKSVLSREAISRVIIVVNNLNEPISQLVYVPWDSGVSASGTGAANFADAQNYPTANSYEIDTSASLPLIGAPVDSITVNVSMGTTAPTTGNVEIYIGEVL